MAQWLIQNGGLWGVIVVALAAVVVYLDRRSTAAYLRQIAVLERQNATLESENARLVKRVEDLHEARKQDAQANTQALLQAADKTWQGVNHMHEIATALKIGK